MKKIPKKESIKESQQRGGENPPLIALKDFEGSMNGKKFHLKKGEAVKANEVQINWLRKFDAV